MLNVYLMKNIFYTFFLYIFDFFSDTWFFKVLKMRKNLEKMVKIKKPFGLLNFTYFSIFGAKKSFAWSYTSRPHRRPHQYSIISVLCCSIALKRGNWEESDCSLYLHTVHVSAQSYSTKQRYFVFVKCVRRRCMVCSKSVSYGRTRLQTGFY